MPTGIPSFTQPEALLGYLSPANVSGLTLGLWPIGQRCPPGPWGASPHLALGGGLRMPRLNGTKAWRREEVILPRPLDCNPRMQIKTPNAPGSPGLRRSGAPWGSRQACVVPEERRETRRPTKGLEPRPLGPPGGHGNPEATRPAAPRHPASRHSRKGSAGPPSPQPERRPLTHPAMAALGLRLRRPGPGASIAARGGRRRGARAGHHD